VNFNGYIVAREIRLTNLPRTHLRGYGPSEVGVVAMLRPAKEVPQIYPLSIKRGTLDSREGRCQARLWGTVF
jgi:hypothetical protein